MRRLHLVEIHEQSWCPRTIRDGFTGCLQLSFDEAGLYDPVAPMLADALKKAGATQIVDLCSGAGGPWSRLLRQLEDRGVYPRIRLTDKHPNVKSEDETRSERVRVSVDAMNVPSDLNGFRTIFSAFHHFRPAEARRILVDAVECDEGIAIFEVTDRRWLHILANVGLALAWPFVVLARARRFPVSVVLFSTLLPVLAIVQLIDGVVSCLRTYTVRELLELTQELDEFRWDAGRIPIRRGPLSLTYLVGTPRV